MVLETMSRTLERFPRTIHSIDELSEQVAEIVRQYQSVDPIRYMILIPPGTYPVRRTVLGLDLPFGSRKTPERTLVFGQHTLTIIEAEQSSVSAITTVPMAALLAVHLFLVLLYSWIELLWEDQGEVEGIRIEYNSVGSQSIWQGVTRIRETFPRRAFHGSDIQPGIDLADFPLKFRNYLRSSLMSEERLIAAVYQPAIRPKSNLWNRFRRGDKLNVDYTISRRFFPLDRLQSALLEPGRDADQLRFRFGQRGSIYDVGIALESPYGQQLCDLIRDRNLTGGAGT
jgi:hypothetical protein